MFTSWLKFVYSEYFNVNWLIVLSVSLLKQVDFFFFFWGNQYYARSVVDSAHLNTEPRFLFKGNLSCFKSYLLKQLTQVIFHISARSETALLWHHRPQCPEIVSLTLVQKSVFCIRTTIKQLASADISHSVGGNYRGSQKACLEKNNKRLRESSPTPPFALLEDCT